MELNYPDAERPARINRATRRYLTLAAPYLYPTGEGGVQAEWSLDQWEATLDIDLKSKTAYWHALNQSSDEETEREINLSSLDGWKWLADQLTLLVPGDSGE